MDKLPIILGKSISVLSRALKLGEGATWSGHVALALNPHFAKDILKKSGVKIILVAGTNGKTTTSKLLKSILEEDGKTVFLNQSGANLLNGIASAIISASDLSGTLRKDYAIFEVDENTVPLIIDQITPDYLIALNLFRDQLDRYGEIDKIARNWKECFNNLPSTTTLILNADDPLISFLSSDVSAKTAFFGLSGNESNTRSKQDAADSIYCLYCGNKLFYKSVVFSHLGDWHCQKCGHKRPNLDNSRLYESSLNGVYNTYNILAASLTSKMMGINEKVIKKAVLGFKPAFGRQEIIKKDGKEVRLFLSKNPTSFNESLRTIVDLKGKDLLIVLNDRIPDGRDISWIWDTNIEGLLKNCNIYVSGDRAYDMALRIKYAGFDNFYVEPDLKKAINGSIARSDGKLFILPTYSAMLEVRRILTGKKIL